MEIQTENIDSIFIEFNESGVVAVHGEIDDTAFINLIAPAIIDLHHGIQRLCVTQRPAHRMQDAGAKSAGALDS